MSNNKKIMYKEVNVWQRKNDGTLCCFRCFELIPEGRFCVQSMDIYSHDYDIEKEQYFSRQFVELLQDEPPEERSDLFPSLEEAIQAHIDEFDEF